MPTLLRQYELYIGRIPELEDREKDPDTSKSDGTLPSSDIRTTPARGDFILLTDHHFEAEIKFIKEGKGDKNVTHEFSIYNPSPETEKFINQGNLLILKAGYNTDEFLPIICATQIIKSCIEKSGPDRVLNITCSEAYNARRKLWYSKSFLSTQTKGNVLDDMLNTFKYYGVPTGRVQIPSDLRNTKLGTGYSIMGNLAKHLEKFCSGNGLRWYMAGGEIFVEPIGKTQNDFINVVEVESGQVKNTIEILDDTSNKKDKEIETRTKGITFTVNLLADCNRGDGVQIKPKEDDSESFKRHEGRYLISSVIHKLSYEGAEWDTTIEARAV